MKDYGNSDFSGLTITGGTYQTPVLNYPTINGATLTNPVTTGGQQVDSLSISNLIVEKGWTVNFDGTAANQKFDLYCTNNTGLESLMDVTVTCGYGTLVKRFALQKQGNGMIQSGSRYSEVIGNIAPYLAVSDLMWDTVNLRWIFKIVNRAIFGIATPASVSVHLITSTAVASSMISTYGISSIYTTDTTTYPEPMYQFAGAITADALIVNFIKKGVNYTVTTADSIIMTTAGVTITLPAPGVVGIGRSFTIKNLQNSVTTAVVTGGALIDSASSFSVGNKRTYTFTSDGTAYWITSAY